MWQLWRGRHRILVRRRGRRLLSAFCDVNMSVRNHDSRMIHSRLSQTQSGIDSGLNLVTLNFHNREKLFRSLTVGVLRQELCLFLRVGSRPLKLRKVNAEP